MLTSCATIDCAKHCDVSGFGVGLMFIPPMAIIPDYFDRYKSLVSGITLCGHSLSSFILIAMIRHCIDTVGWRGAMMIQAGCTLNGCVFAMLFVSNKPKRTKSERKFTSQLTVTSRIFAKIANFRKPFMISNRIIHVLPQLVDPGKIVRPNFLLNESPGPVQLCSSTDCHNPVQTTFTVTSEVSNSSVTNKKYKNCGLDSENAVDSFQSLNEHLSQTSNQNQSSIPTENGDVQHKDEVHGQMQKQKQLSSNTEEVKSHRLQTNNVTDHMDAPEPVQKLNKLHCSRKQASKQSEQEESQGCFLSSLCSGNLFLFIFANCLMSGEVSILYQLTPARAVSKGLSKFNSSYLVTCIGMASTLSRVLVSGLSGMTCISHIELYTVFGCGMVVSMSVVCFVPHSFIPNAVMAGSAGFNLGETIHLNMLLCLVIFPC